MPLAQIKPETRLGEDLGVDGNDAVALMEIYSKEFNVDIEDLWVHWDTYFSKKGVTLQSGVALLVIWGVTDIMLQSLFESLHLWIYFAIDFALIFLWAGFNTWRRQLRYGRKEITVADLAAAAEKGRLRLK